MANIVTRLHGSVDKDMLRAVSESIDYSNFNDTLCFELYSLGGKAPIALAIYDLIRCAKQTVHVKCIGAVYSAATLILAGADIRSMGASCWLMVHDSPDASKGTSDELLQNEKEESQWAQILAKHSNADEMEWRKLSKEETYLTARETLQMGLIDYIEPLKGAKL